MLGYNLSLTYAVRTLRALTTIQRTNKMRALHKRGKH